MPSLYNVIDDVKQSLYPNGEVNFEIQQRNSNRYIIYIEIPNAQHRGKVEFLVEDNGEVLGSVLRHGCVSRRTMALIMDSIIERM